MPSLGAKVVLATWLVRWLFAVRYPSNSYSNCNGPYLSAKFMVDLYIGRRGSRIMFRLSTAPPYLTEPGILNPNPEGPKDPRIRYLGLGQ